MRILVLGHSDSAGLALPDPSLAWPRLLTQDLPNVVGEPVDVTHRILWALRPGAADFVDAAIDESQPDLVLIGVNPFAFALGLVVVRAEQRFGARTARIFRKVEAAFDRRTRNGRLASGLNLACRRLARRIIGVAPVATYHRTAKAYEEVLARLARHEGLDVVVMGGVRFGKVLRQQNPGMLDQVERFRVDMQALAEKHHFAFFDTDEPVAGPGRDSYFYPDGTHRNPAGHRRMAEFLIGFIAARS